MIFSRRTARDLMQGNRQGYPKQIALTKQGRRRVREVVHT